MSYGTSLDGHELIGRMQETLKHGGPDAFGIKSFEDEKVFLAHRRLSIIDLSEEANQPMSFMHYSISYNGEIYNYKDVQATLIELGYSFKTDSDTEVILKAFHHWGYDSVKHFHGMFAFAIWDDQLKRLILCRDRVGVKPMHFYRKDGLFMFASEIKAFHCYRGFDKEIDYQSVQEFLCKGYITSPRSIFRNVKKLNPGSFLEIDQNGVFKEIPYWNLNDHVIDKSIAELPEAEVEDQMEKVLQRSFELRMVSDVPVGVFLSGGIDSSLVTALLQKNSTNKLKTFTIGFHDKNYNEAESAKSISDYLGTEHTELYLSEKDFLQVVPLLPDIYDEPFADNSTIPTFLLSKMTSESVKVSLSADGGDELFGGYERYRFAKNFAGKIKKIPKPIRKTAASIVGKINPEAVERNRAKLPFVRNFSNVVPKIHKLEHVLRSDDINGLYSSINSYVDPSLLEKLMVDGLGFNYPELSLSDKNFIVSDLGAYDFKTYLEGDILAKVDRASMANALESREPFLDQDIAEMALALPDSLKIQGNETKRILRNILYKHIPRELVDRPKQGFVVPITSWLKKVFLSELEEIKEDKDFFDQFKLNRSFVSQQIDLFVNSSIANPSLMWFIYTLHAWYKHWI